jgi:hypothetical protein
MKGGFISIEFVEEVAAFLERGDIVTTPIFLHILRLYPLTPIKLPPHAPPQLCSTDCCCSNKKEAESATSSCSVADSLDSDDSQGNYAGPAWG